MNEVDFPALSMVSSTSNGRWGRPDVSRRHNQAPPQQPATITKNYSDFKLTLPNKPTKAFRRAIDLSTSASSLSVVSSRFEAISSSSTQLKLSADAVRVRDVDPMRGGIGRGFSAAISECLSFEILHRTFSAELVSTERELFCHDVIADYLAQIFGKQILVSVTRAYQYGGGSLDVDEAANLIDRKISGLLQAAKKMTTPVVPVLHLWAADNDTADALKTTLDSNRSVKKSGVVVLITTAVVGCKLEYSYLFGKK